MTARRASVIVASLLTSLLLSSPALALYKWKDENGVTHYSDKVPPSAAKSQREELDKQGNTRKVLERQKTAEEIKADQAAQQQKEAEVAKTREKAANDRYLLQTYPDEVAIAKARSERLKLIDSNITLAQQSKAGTEKAVADLGTRVANAEKGGKKAPPVLVQQLNEHKFRLQQTNEALARLESDRKNAEIKFDADLARYRELKTAPATRQ